jgi:3-hydroxyanthranilate 3,4-dioxygenase
MDVMVVGGGTSRVDFHDDPHPEFFHQLEGSMVLRLMEEPGSPPRDVEIRAGEVFMLPAHVRHSPRRTDPDGVGIVVEFARPDGVVDGFEWFCEGCHHLLHRVEVAVASIVDDLPPLFAAFADDLDARTCPRCGVVHPGSG